MSEPPGSEKADLMSDADLDLSVADWVIDYPGAAAVFETLGIDYCCGGRSLGYACRQQGLDPAAVLRQLEEAIERARPSDSV